MARGYDLLRATAYYVARYNAQRTIESEVPRVVEPLASLRQLGRFSEPGLLVMISLADRPKHGYAMLEDIETLAGLRLGPGTLYGALARLERLGLIAPLAPVERRRPYQLTQVGASVLATELTTWQKLASTGLRRLEVPA